MSSRDYAGLMRARTQADTTPATTTVEILVDIDSYAPAVKAWEAAKLATQQAEQAVHDASQGTEGGPKRRLNSASPAGKALAAHEAAQTAEGEARDAVRACFIRLHLTAPTSNDLTQARVEAEDDDGFYLALARHCLSRVTDHKGQTLEEITPEVLAAYLPVAPFGERVKVHKALDKAVEPIDFPTF